MSHDPKRIFETVTGELAELRSAIAEVRHLEPSEHDLELIASRLQRALDTAPMPATEPDDLDEASQPEPSRLDDRGEPSVDGGSESVPGEKLVDSNVEPEVAGGLTATLLAAGAAMVWLRRQKLRSPFSESDDDDQSE